MKRKRLATKKGYWGDKKTKRVSTPYRREYYKNNSYNMYKSPRELMPQEYVTTLTYSVQGVLTNSPAAVATKAFRSEAYDVDPALATTAMPGFAELAQLYSRYRCLSMSYDIQTCNREAFALQVMTGFTATNVAFNTVEYLGNAYVKSQIISAKGGLDRCRLKGSVSAVQLFGTRQAIYDDLFTGSTASATLANAGTMNLYYSILSPSLGLTVAGGVDFNAEVRLRLQFYRPYALIG